MYISICDTYTFRYYTILKYNSNICYLKDYISIYIYIRMISMHTFQHILLYEIALRNHTNIILFL